MDDAPPHGVRDEPPALLPFPAPASAKPPSERRSEILLDALKTAITVPGEHRLFRSGKLRGLFPSKAGASAQAATFALEEGLLESTRMENRGKTIEEWVKITPAGVNYVHDRDTPKAVLREFKSLLDASQNGLPAWMDEFRAELTELSHRFETRSAAMLSQLTSIAARVESALRRAEANAPSPIAGTIGKSIEWAEFALEYLDRRGAASPGTPCLLSELFHALSHERPGLTLGAFHTGLVHLHDTRAIRLLPTPSAELGEPEYALVVEGKLMDRVSR